MIDTGLHDRLVEWGIWANSRGWLSTCRSIEGRYLPPAGEVWERDPKPLPPDARDAWKIECAWRLMPWKPKMILKAQYVATPRPDRPPTAWPRHMWERHLRHVCRELCIPWKEWEPSLDLAVRAIDNRLKRV